MEESFSQLHAEGAPEPARAGGGGAGAPDVTAHAPLAVLGLPLPQPLADELRKVGREFKHYRLEVLKVVPAAVVNHSTNVIAFTQLIGEACMLLSSVKPAQAEELKHPLKTLSTKLGDAVRNAFGHAPFEMRGGQKIYTANPWAARSTLAGMSLMALAAFTPDPKDKGENIEEMAEIRARSPLGYAAERIKQGLTLWDGHHKRQHVGLGITLAGVFSMISGFTNVNHATGKRFINHSHSLGGAISAAAGSMLLFSPTNEQGWARYGSLMWLRMATIFGSLQSKIKNSENWQMYGLGQLGLQGANTISALIGGAEKREDGSVIDHAGTERQAYTRALTMASARHSSERHAEEAAPDATVSQVALAEKAMPAREAGQAVG